MTQATEIIQKLQSLADPKKAAHSQRFFKTGKGEYGEGDIFLGLNLVQINAMVKEYTAIVTLNEVEKLLHSEFHEVRTLAVCILVKKFEKAKKDFAAKIAIVELYLRNVAHINNWDLVDISAYKILGAFVYEQEDSTILYELSDSQHLWSERMSVVSCMYLIKRDKFEDIKFMAVKFLSHKHDLMHKAVGWMLREMGKRNLDELCSFLNNYASQMPRTMLRYAIEKLPSEERKKYMQMK